MGLIILFFFFALRLIYITRFPLMEAEASNIRYGQMMVWQPDLRFASFIYASKQPLAYWLFGSVNILTGNLIAPRLVSLFFGLVTLIFMYLWVRMLFDKQSAIVSTALVAITPLFIHFQSLALMESMLLATTVVSLWTVTAFAKAQNFIYVIILGLTSAIGFWIKTTALVPAAVCLFAVGYFSFLKHRLRLSSIIPVIIALVVIFILLFPLVIQPKFHRVFGDVSVFTFTWDELLKFPVSVWTANILQVVFSMLVYGGPLFFLALLLSAFHIRKRKIQKLALCTILFLIVPVIFNKFITTRYYIVAFIPLVIIAATGVRYIIHGHVLLKIAGFIFFIITCVLSLILIFDARIFFRLFPDAIPLNAERGYALGWSSGYATREAVNVLNDQQKIPSRAVIAVQDFTGNPTDYIMASYYFNSNRPTVFVNKASELDRLEPFRDMFPVYFVTRSNLYYEDLKPYLTKLYSFRSPESEDYVEIYLIN